LCPLIGFDRNNLGRYSYRVLGDRESESTLLEEAGVPIARLAAGGAPGARRAPVLAMTQNNLGNACLRL